MRSITQLNTRCNPIYHQYMYMCIYVYMYMCIYVIHIYIYILIHRCYPTIMLTVSRLPLRGLGAAAGPRKSRSPRDMCIYIYIYTILCLTILLEFFLVLLGFPWYFSPKCRRKPNVPHCPRDMYICVYIYIYMYIRVYICYLSIYLSLYIYVYTYMYICIHI